MVVVGAPARGRPKELEAAQRDCTDRENGIEGEGTFVSILI